MRADRIRRSAIRRPRHTPAPFPAAAYIPASPRAHNRRALPTPPPARLQNRIASWPAAESDQIGGRGKYNPLALLLPILPRDYLFDRADRYNLGAPFRNATALLFRSESGNHRPLA